MENGYIVIGSRLHGLPSVFTRLREENGVKNRFASSARGLERRAMKRFHPALGVSDVEVSPPIRPRAVGVLFELPIG